MSQRRPPQPPLPRRQPRETDEQQQQEGSRGGSREPSEGSRTCETLMNRLRICRAPPKFASNRNSVMSTASTATTSSARSTASGFSVMSSASSISSNSTSNTAPPSYSPRSLKPMPPSTTQAITFHSLLTTLSDTPIRYENVGLLDEALRVVPLDRIIEEAEFDLELITAQAASLGKLPQYGIQDCMVKALMKWFKYDFFTWVNTPPCNHCGHETISQGAMQPTPEEKALGAGKTEIFICTDPACGQIDRFPRYSDVWTLMQTRRGRCGEWANTFTMLCRAMGWRARWVWNSEDHVWTEVWSLHANRWIHVDACENAYDKPMLYTREWKRRLAYCIAFSREGAMDVTRRYVRDRHLQALPRSRCSEENLLYTILEVRAKRRARMTPEEVRRCEKEDELEEKELRRLEAAVASARRKMKEKEAGEARGQMAEDWLRSGGGEMGGEMSWMQDSR